MPKRLTQEEFIRRAKEAHGNRYDYSKVEYVNNSTKVCIICSIHGEFWQRPYEHMAGHGCDACGGTAKLDTEAFIKKAQKVHGGKCNYSNVDYTTSSSYVTIICPKHGPFRQSAYNHMNGQGCPHCKKSRGELRIKEWLDAHDILYISEYRIPIEQVLFGRNNVRVDFWLPCHNIVIEYNGIQHYERQPDWQSIDEFQEQQDRDKRVRKYCNNNGLNLIEIPYTKYEDIPNILHQNILNNRR